MVTMVYKKKVNVHYVGNVFRHTLCLNVTYNEQDTGQKDFITGTLYNENRKIYLLYEVVLSKI